MAFRDKILNDYGIKNMEDLVNSFATNIQVGIFSLMNTESGKEDHYIALSYNVGLEEGRKEMRIIAMFDDETLQLRIGRDLADLFTELQRRTIKKMINDLNEHFRGN